jgi:hypothetical protein
MVPRAHHTQKQGSHSKWCSTTCRHRAWEMKRAAASHRTAVDVVERLVPVRAPVEPTRRDWPRLLDTLGGQLDDGRLYDRDLPTLGRSLELVLKAYWRRARPTGVSGIL